MINFQWTSQLSMEAGIAILMYGLPGVGKTYSARTLQNPMIISTEGLLLSLRKDQIPYVQCANSREFEEVFDWMEQSEESKQYQFMVDGISDYAQMFLRELKASGTIKDGRQQYGELLDHVTGLCRRIREMDRDIVITAQEGLFVDHDQMGRVGCAMPGQKLSSAIPFYFDEVFQLAIVPDSEGNDTRVFRTQPSPQFTAKDQSGALELWEQIDFTAIFNKIRSS